MDLVLVAGALAIGFALYGRGRGASAPGGAAKAKAAKRPAKPVALKTQATRPATRVVTRVVREAAKPQDATKLLGQAVVNATAPALPGAAARTAGAVLGEAGSRASFYGGAVGAAGGALSKAGEIASQANVPLLGIFASKLTGLRGASKQAQTKMFGTASVETLATGVSATVPLVGPLLGQGLRLLAGTYEGKRVVKAVGTAEEQAYTVQRKALSGHVSEAFSGGGSSHKERVALLLSSQAKAALPGDQREVRQTVQNSPSLKAQDDAARKLAQDIADGKGKPGDVSSLSVKSAEQLNRESLARQKLAEEADRAAIARGEGQVSAEQIAKWSAEAHEAEAKQWAAGELQRQQEAYERRYTREATGWGPIGAQYINPET